jgi:hypothetical protein
MDSELPIALHEAVGVDLPESDYSRLSTFRSIVEYLESKEGIASATLTARPIRHVQRAV